MIFSLLLAAATVSSAAEPASPAPQAQIERDLRCVAVFTVILGMDVELSDIERMGVTGGVYYYIGRIEGRDPEFDLQANMIRLLEAKDYQTQFPVDAERCGKELEAKGQLLIDMGKAMQVHAASSGSPKT